MAQLIELEYFNNFSRINLNLYNDDLVKVIHTAADKIRLDYMKNNNLKQPNWFYYVIYTDFVINQQNKKPVSFSFDFNHKLERSKYQEFIYLLSDELRKKNIYVKILKYL